MNIMLGENYNVMTSTTTSPTSYTPGRFEWILRWKQQLAVIVTSCSQPVNKADILNFNISPAYGPIPSIRNRHSRMLLSRGSATARGTGSRCSMSSSLRNRLGDIKFAILLFISWYQVRTEPNLGNSSGNWRRLINESRSKQRGTQHKSGKRRGD
jgi:hypothetical protein